MNNKLLTVVLVAGIATTGFAGISAANEGLLGENIENKIDSIEWSFEKRFEGEKWERKFGKRMGMKNLTDAEKIALKSMTGEEKKVFFDAKKAEKKAEHEARSAIIDKLMAGEKLTAAEEATRLEMLAKIEEHQAEGKRFWGKENHREVIAKLLAGDELTNEERVILKEMKAKKAEREAKRALIEPLLEKMRAGEELTDEEKQVLKDNTPERKEKRGHHGKGECDHDED